MNKRGYYNVFPDVPRLRLKLASEGAAAAPLKADKQVACLFSAVARGLPNADEWDLTTLLVDGQPASRATAVAWLNAAYQSVFEDDFEAQQPAQDTACTMAGLCQLLLFADAVGSTKALLRACCTRLGSMQLHAQLGQQQVALDTDGTSYFFGKERTRLSRQPDLSNFGVVLEDAPAASAEEQAAFKQQVATQTEQLLWLAYRLELQSLVQHLHRFVQALSFFDCSVLHGMADAIFTPRVLEAAGVASLPGGTQMLMSSVTGEVLKLTDHHVTGLTQQQRQPLKFDAVLHSSSLRILQRAPVAVELDLFGASTIKLGVATFDVQLRIGPHHAAPKMPNVRHTCSVVRHWLGCIYLCSAQKAPCSLLA